MKPSVFSYFQYRTRLISPDELHLQLQPADQDGSRFWLTLVYALRSVQSGVGQALLNRLIDHHSAVDESAILNLVKEVEGWQGGLVFENLNFLEKAAWRGQFEQFREAISTSIKSKISIADPYQDQKSLQYLTSLQPDLRALLASTDSWWLDWLAEKQELPTLAGDSMSLNTLDRWNVALPSWSLQKNLGSTLQSTDFAAVALRITDLQGWLLSQRQWLESLRYDLMLKNFEQAAQRMQENADFWQEDAQSALEQLFWLRELPSVLLHSRPQLCLQAAQAAQRLDLPLQVSYYRNLARQQLESLRRLARNESDWRRMELDESGTSLGSLLNDLERLEG